MAVQHLAKARPRVEDEHPAQAHPLPRAELSQRVSAAQEEDRLLTQLVLDVAHDRHRCERLRRVLNGTRARLDAARQELAAARRLAERDPLTGLPNRRALDDMGHALLQAAHAPTGLTAVLFVDLDGFKPVNDRHGHAVGDALLRLVARRLTEAIRAVDRVYRVGGDEFVCVLLELPHAGQAVTIAQHIVRLIEAPCPTIGPGIALRASVGVALHARGDVNVVQLSRRADEAMYRAKGRGGGVAVEVADG